MARFHLVAAAACAALAASAPVAQPPPLNLNVTSSSSAPRQDMPGVVQFVTLSMDDALHETNGVLTEKVGLS